MRQIGEEREKVKICREAYDKLSRRFELLVNRKAVIKKEYSTSELFGILFERFRTWLGKIFASDR
jgi:hypothetical protein